MLVKDLSYITTFQVFLLSQYWSGDTSFHSLSHEEMAVAGHKKHRTYYSSLQKCLIKNFLELSSH